MQAESSFNLTVVGDNGTSYGLCQWHNSRWTNLKNYAASIGKDQSDLDSQLGYLKQEIDGGAAGGGYSSITDPSVAAEQFCRKFERPSEPSKKVPGRQQNAIEFYNAFSGQNYSYNGSSSTTGGTYAGVSSDFGTKKNPNSKAGKFFNLISTIGSAFTSAFTGSIFNKNGSDDFSSYSSGLSDTNGETLNNNIDVASYPGKQPVEYMRDVLGKLKYSKTNRDPEKGGGDCSSTVAWALTKAGIPVTNDSRWQYMNNTNPYTHPSWQNVVWYDNGKRFEERNPGKNVEDLVHLKPNDVLFYSWKNSTSTYPDHVDHVEMYNGNGQLIGNGGGIGTRTRSVHDMQGDIIKIARPKLAASGSGLDLSDYYINGNIKSTARGNVYNFNDYKRSAKRSAGASDLSGLNISKDTAILLRTMITLVESIVKNTNDISLIYKFLQAKLGESGMDSESAEALSKLVDEKNVDTERIEDSLAGLKATVDAILAS